jgi:hypothetical protein
LQPKHKCIHHPSEGARFLIWDAFFPPENIKQNSNGELQIQLYRTQSLLVISDLVFSIFGRPAKICHSN